MTAGSLPSFYVRAIVTSVDVDSLNVYVHVRPEGAEGDEEPVVVTFQRFDEHIGLEMVEDAAELEAGAAVEVEWTQIADGVRTIRLGRSITKRSAWSG